jgi:hypothetical protein
MEYKIKITRLEYIPTYNTYEKVVNKVYWDYEATKDAISTRIQGSTDLTPPESIFVPFYELEESIVIGWISGSLDIDNLQSVLIESIDNPKVKIYDRLNKQAKIQSDPPWIPMPSGSSNI